MLDAVTGTATVPGPVTRPTQPVLTPLQKMAAYANDLVRDVAGKTVTALKPSNLLVPGGAPAVSASLKAVEAVGAAGTAAAEGIKEGFSKAALIITLVAVFVVYRVIKG